MFESEVEYILRYVGIDHERACPTSPISFSRILPKFDIKLKFAEFSDETSGMYIRSNKGNYILINENHHFYRKRFSLGHEFGHHFLGHPSDISQLIPGNANRQREIEANKFGAGLLMPPDLILRLHKTMTSITEASQWLRVSAVSTAIRFRELCLRQEEAEILISDYWSQIGDVQPTVEGVVLS